MRRVLKLSILLTVFLISGCSNFSLNICYSDTVQTEIKIGDPGYSPDGERIAFARLVTKYQEPVGVCRFPNGGIRRIVENQLEVFIVDKPLSIPRLVDSNDFISDVTFSMNVGPATVNWNNNEIAVLLLEEEGGKTVPIVWIYELEKNSWIKDDTYDRDGFTSSRFKPNDIDVWLDYDSYTPENGIAAFRGTEFQYHPEKNSISTSGMEATVLVEKWVSAEVLRNL